jgi:protein-S-isoprenylcysteine O-methyltransferase Ste14
VRIHEAPALHLAFASLHVLVGNVGASLIHRWRYGRNPNVLGVAPQSKHLATTHSIAALTVAWAAGITCAAYWEAYRLDRKGAPLVLVPAAVSWSIAVAGLALMVAAQLSMGDAFRIGQDPARGPDALCETGLHRYSRNPIYVGSWMCLFGMTLWWPSAFILLLCLTIGALMHRLVLDEERFLRERFGAAFEAYEKRVPRYLWVPR